MKTIFKEYKSKPTVISAVLLTEENYVRELSTIKANYPGQDSKLITYYQDIQGFCIASNHGHVCADIGDYLIQGLEGEFYPCKASIFEELYEVIDERKV